MNRYSTIYFTWLGSIILFLGITLTTSSEIKAQYAIYSQFGNLTDCDTVTSGIYIVWWDNTWNNTAAAEVLLDSMTNYRKYCLDDLYMQDPPNPEDGYYYNVYLHQPGDLFPDGWALGQGTDINGYPFLTIPVGTLNDWVSIAHETFHIFQYNSNSNGFSYSGDSQWYIEASANWFAAIQNPNENTDFLEAESLVRLPQVCLWLSYDNFPSYYPQNWQRYVHQYALSVLLIYLTEETGMPQTMITEGFFNGTTELPQEYFYNQLGPAIFRSYFLNWAAHMTNHFDFLLPGQIATFENEWNTYADPEDNNEFIQIYNNSGSNGWFQPVDSLVTTAWSFNTYKLLNQSNVVYTFEVIGDAEGSAGVASYFQGKVLVQNSMQGSNFYNLNMINDQQGSLSLDLTSADTTVFFIIGSVPDVFEDVEQTFPYMMRITKGTTTGLKELPANKISKKIIGRYNLMGQKVNEDDAGIQILYFSDGTVSKILKYAH